MHISGRRVGLKRFWFGFIKLFVQVVSNVPVNSLGHVGTLPPFNGTFNVMVSKRGFFLFKYKLPNKPHSILCVDAFDLEPHFLDRLRPVRLTSN